ncbi:MAG: 4-(cytidine 5'-diphospho)-2-C-methyl-D-erythritol kinase, partial [Candidatus Bipolaricaulia bacterium]
MKLRAYAKINLGLRVFQRQADSYHRIQGLMQSIGLCDQLVLERFGKGIELSVEPTLGIPAEENLAYRAAELMAETANLTPNLRIQLMKRIPVGAGLGGGSSDAAAVLVGINELFNLGMDKAKLLELAAELGSDPSFFLEGGTCLVAG